MGHLMPAELSVNADRCTGHGRCYTAAPTLLQDDDEGFVTLRGRTMTVSGEQLGAAREAVDACPERAITLTRD
jgi:ferredoxin